jgi:hypothetical protein
MTEQSVPPTAPTAEQLAQFVERCGHELTPWQRDILEHMAAGKGVVFLPARGPARRALEGLLRRGAAEPVGPPGGAP